MTHPPSSHLAPSAPSRRPPLSWEYAMPCPGGASNRRCFGTVVGPRQCPSHRPNQAPSLPHGSRSNAPLEKSAWAIRLEWILSRSTSPWPIPLQGLHNFGWLSWLTWWTTRSVLYHLDLKSLAMSSRRYLRVKSFWGFKLRADLILAVPTALGHLALQV